MAVGVGPVSPTFNVKVSLIDLRWASVAVTVIGLLPKSPSVGVPEITPVWALMLRPAGKLAENVFFFNDAAAAEISALSRHDALPILALWLAMAVAVGPLSP